MTFPRNPKIAARQFSFFRGYLLLAAIFFFLHPPTFWAFFIASTFTLINAFWSKRTPLFEINDETLVWNRSMFQKESLNLLEIISVDNTQPNSYQIRLKSGESKTISLGSLNQTFHSSITSLLPPRK